MLTVTGECDGSVSRSRVGTDTGPPLPLPAAVLQALTVRGNAAALPACYSTGKALEKCVIVRITLNIIDYVIL